MLQQNHTIVFTIGPDFKFQFIISQVIHLCLTFLGSQYNKLLCGRSKQEDVLPRGPQFQKA